MVSQEVMHGFVELSLVIPCGLIRVFERVGTPFVCPPKSVDVQMPMARVVSDDRYDAGTIVGFELAYKSRQSATGLAKLDADHEVLADRDQEPFNPHP